MKFIIYFISIFCILFFISCSNSVSPNENIEFGTFDVHYQINGGWIVPGTLDILHDGKAIAKTNFNKDSIVVKMDENSKGEISKLITGFSNYKRHYEPDDFWTDQAYEMIVLKTENKSDTVSAYDRAHGNLPKQLNKLFNWLNNYQKNITDKNQKISGFLDE